jgi:hypothetical protein
MAGGLGFPFEVSGPNFRKVSFRNYREYSAIPSSTGGTATII